MGMKQRRSETDTVTECKYSLVRGLSKQKGRVLFFRLRELSEMSVTSELVESGRNVNVDGKQEYYTCRITQSSAQIPW